MRKPRIGLALGSGGARGWCHIGAIRALAEIGVEPDVVAGTSMGAVVGAAWAGGQLDALEDWVRALTPSRYVSLMDLRLGQGGLVEARKIGAMLEEIGVAGRIEDLPRPFAAVATDMETGREVWFTRGATFPAVRASAGIPGVMNPVYHDRRWLLDGGLTNPVPVSVARALGAEVIIAVNPNGRQLGRIWRRPERKPPPAWLTEVLPAAWHEPFGLTVDEDANPARPSYFEVISASIDVMAENIRRSRLAGDPPHVMLEASLEGLTTLELHRGAEAMEEGRRVVAEQAERIRAVCGL